MTILWYL